MHKLGDEWGVLMKVFEPYLDTIKVDEHKSVISGLLAWVINKYPMLDHKIAWNQPHFVHNGTFIIAFAHAKQHFSVAPEYKAISEFKKDIRDSEYLSTNFIFKIKWRQPINYDLISRIIEFNMKDKAGMKTYWRTTFE